MITPAQIKLTAYVVAIILVFASGWTTRGWYEASKAQAAKDAKAKAEKAAQARESEIAQVVEDQLTKVNESRGVVYRETVKVVNRPVYQSDCLDAAGLSLVNQAAGYPAEPADKVPQSAKAPVYKGR